MKSPEIKDKKLMSDEEWIPYLKDVFTQLNLPFKPTFTHSSGIKMDFCWGLRILFPDDLPQYRLTIIDFQSRLKIFETLIPAGEYYVSEKKYFIDYGVIISNPEDGKEILRHRM